MSKLGDYLWGRATAAPHEWHAILFHDPEFVTEVVESEKLTAARRAREGEDAAPVTFTKVLETKPGHAIMVCGLGRGRVKDGPVVRRQGVAITDVGVDPEDGDSIHEGCRAVIEATG